MPETTTPADPLQHATLEDLVAALGPKRGGRVEIAEDDEVELEAQADVEVEVDAGVAAAVLSDELPMDDDDDLSQIEGEASPRLVSIVESLLFASTGPLTVKQLRKLLKDPSKEQIQRALKQLATQTEGRGVVLHQVAGGFRLRTNPENAQFVQRMLTARPIRLSRSQLEALAVIAYRQPVTKAEVDHVRGVDGSAVLKLLLDRDLIKIVGRKEEPGRPLLYGTTVNFLELFNLKSLRDMPDLHEFRELSEESQAALRESLGDEAALHEEQEALGQERLTFEAEEARAAEAARQDADRATADRDDADADAGDESDSDDESGSDADSDSDSDSDSDADAGSDPDPDPEPRP
jgi:segregation and condensation protein B